MENEKNELEQRAGEMHKRRETMPDGKRYIIYYTFGENKEIDLTENNSGEVRENV